MVRPLASTTATQIASSRRKLRLAQAQGQGQGGSGAVGRGGGGPQQQQQQRPPSSSSSTASSSAPSSANGTSNGAHHGKRSSKSMNGHGHGHSHRGHAPPSAPTNARTRSRRDRRSPSPAGGPNPASEGPASPAEQTGAEGGGPAGGSGGATGEPVASGSLSPAAQRRLMRHGGGGASASAPRGGRSAAPSSAASDAKPGRGRSRRSRAATGGTTGGAAGGAKQAAPDRRRARSAGVAGGATASDDQHGAPAARSSRRGGGRRTRDGASGASDAGADVPPGAGEPSDNPVLNLRVAESVDSDDNGTCFNSVGTATPRQAPEGGGRPSPRGGGGEPAPPDSRGSRRDRAARGRRARHNAAGHPAPVGALSPLREDGGASSSEPAPSSSSARASSAAAPASSDPWGGRGRSIWDRPEEMVSARPPAPGGREGGAHARSPGDGGATGYAEFDPEVGPGAGGARLRGRAGSGAAAYRPGPTPSGMGGMGSGASVDSRLRRRPLDGGEGGGAGVAGADVDGVIWNQPNVRAALGVGAAATLGAAVLGPVGLLVGAASVGIAAGVMQIPAEQRDDVRRHASASLERARDIACDLSDHVSANCARYGVNGPGGGTISSGDGGSRTGGDARTMLLGGGAIPGEILDSCCHSGGAGEEGGGGPYDPMGGQHNAFRGPGGRGRSATGDYDGGNSLSGHEGPMRGRHGSEMMRSEGSSPIANAVNGVERGMNRLVGDVFGEAAGEGLHHISPASQSVMMGGGERGAVGADAEVPGDEGGGGRRVACGRKGRVVPLGQIHSLRPSLQPRAWLDVMASAHTTRDDKNEAMQEILILAKDKEISRWFLEEGILDSLMFILSTYFRNYSSFLRNESLAAADPGAAEPFSSFKPGGPAFSHARLAANCCVALGKAHCAKMHTEGDLLLMSAYSRGSVPVERQLAQMLFEVPHHMRAMGGPVPASSRGDNGQGGDVGTGDQGREFDAEFTLTELSMQQAEDLASSIKALDDGRIDV
ncbi:hypothetical protein ACHAWF_009347 [Thalassiosira exigua]